MTLLYMYMYMESIVYTSICMHGAKMLVHVYIHGCVGILRKSRGQVFRLTVVMHMLFNIDNTDQPLDKEVGESAIKAAVNFIQLVCQQTLQERGHFKRKWISIKKVRIYQ